MVRRRQLHARVDEAAPVPRPRQPIRQRVEQRQDHLFRRAPAARAASCSSRNACQTGSAAPGTPRSADPSTRTGRTASSSSRRPPTRSCPHRPSGSPARRTASTRPSGCARRPVSAGWPRAAAIHQQSHLLIEHTDSIPTGVVTVSHDDSAGTTYAAPPPRRRRSGSRVRRVLELRIHRRPVGHAVHECVRPARLALPPRRRACRSGPADQTTDDLPQRPRDPGVDGGPHPVRLPGPDLHRHRPRHHRRRHRTHRLAAATPDRHRGRTAARGTRQPASVDRTGPGPRRSRSGRRR